jgi:hypothetical protein
MGALPQALEIIFEMQRKKINEKITRTQKKKKHQFLFIYSFSLDPSSFQTS